MKTTDILILLAFCGAGFFAVKMITKNKTNTTSSNLFSNGALNSLSTNSPYSAPNLDAWATIPDFKPTSGIIYL